MEISGKAKKAELKRGLILLLLFNLPVFSLAQTVIGQYEEEANLRSWNVTGFVSASGLGRGDIMSVAADGPGVANGNPSLLVELPKWSLLLNGAWQKASLFRFSLVNTGVLRSSNNLWVSTTAIDAAGIAYRLGPWALGLLVAITEYYDRPSVRGESTSGGKKVYELSFRQHGFLRTWTLALARKIGHRLSFGLCLNKASGKIEETVTEAWLTSGVSILDQKEASLDDFYFKLGAAYSITDFFKLTLTFEPPHSRYKNSHSLYEYSTNQKNIRIKGEAEDTINRPLILSLGGLYLLGKRWSLSLEAFYFGWSRYHLTWFGEEVNRYFKDTYRLAAAVENSSSFSLLAQSFLFTTRLGVQFDPQPMKNPSSRYLSLTSGFSCQWKNFRLDFGAAWSQEKGSNRSLQAVRSALSLVALF